MAEEASTSGDQALVQAALRGDDRAKEQLVRLHEGRAYRLAYRLLNSAEDARDAVQEAFLRAFRGLQGLRGERFGPWFARIVVNVCLDERRRRRKAVLLPLERGLGMSETPDWALRSLVKRALAALPDRYRVMLVLRDVEGYSTREAAELLNVEEGTARVLLLRARRKFAEILQELERSVDS